MTNNSPARTEALTSAVAVDDGGEAKDLGAEAVGQDIVLCSNTGANPAFIRSGATSGVTTTFPTAVTASYGQIVMPGAQVVYTKADRSHQHLFCICASGQTTTLYIASCDGR